MDIIIVIKYKISRKNKEEILFLFKKSLNKLPIL